MTRTEYKAAVGSSYKFLMVLFFVLGMIFVIYPLIQTMGGVDLLFYILGFMFVFCSLLLIICARVRYIFSDRGLIIRGMMGATMLHEEYLDEPVPYGSITEFRETKDIAYSAGCTSDAMRIYYTKKNGRKDSFAIGPVDKKEFIAELEKRTGLTIRS